MCQLIYHINLFTQFYNYASLWLSSSMSWTLVSRLHKSRHWARTLANRLIWTASPISQVTIGAPLFHISGFDFIDIVRFQTASLPNTRKSFSNFFPRLHRTEQHQVEWLCQCGYSSPRPYSSHPRLLHAAKVWRKVGAREAVRNTGSKDLESFSIQGPSQSTWASTGEHKKRTLSSKAAEYRKRAP